MQCLGQYILLVGQLSKFSNDKDDSCFLRESYALTVDRSSSCA